MPRHLLLRHLLVASTVGASLVLAAGAAGAEHSHVRHVGQDGACVVVAANGGEDEVVLPARIFELGITSDARGGADHPLHVLVHKGRPNDLGDGVVWELYTSNSCDGYVNQR